MRRASLGRCRAGLVGGCALALVVAAAVIWVAGRPRVPDPASLPSPAPMFVAEDGTTYTRVAVAYLDTSKSSSVEVDVPPGRTPLSSGHPRGCACDRARGVGLRGLRLDAPCPVGARADRSGGGGHRDGAGNHPAVDAPA
jgi:hypothetical protein